MRSSTCCIILARGLALGLLFGRVEAQIPPTAPAEIIPAVAFFQRPEITAPTLSPDGRHIAFIGRSERHACLFLLERTTGQIRRLFKPENGHVESFWWKGDGRILVADYSNVGRGYYIQELDSPKPRELLALQDVPVDWINPLPRDADHVVVAPTAFGSQVFEVDLRNNRRTKVETLTGDSSVVTSIDGELRAYTHRFADTWKVAWRTSARSAWHELKGTGASVPFRPIAMDTDDRHLFVFAYDQGDTVALMRLDPDSDQRTLVVQYAGLDVSHFSLFRSGGVSNLVTSCRFGGEDLQVLDESARPFYAMLARSLPDTFNRWVSSSADGNLRIVYSESARDPGRYYLYDGSLKTLSTLGPRHPDLPPSAMCDVKSFTFQTRDAVSESGYVVLPAKNQAGPPPLLVLPMHFVGEPADPGRDFNYLAQFFASRGFAVARFAIRGTHGFGRDFMRAGDYQFAGRLVQDLEDGVNHLAQAGLVDSKRVGILGWSAGGLIALRTAAASPLFRAVAVFNSWAEFDPNDVSWLTSSEGSMDQILEEIGGGRNAQRIARQLDPETFIPSLSVPALVACSTSYGYAPASRHLRSVFRRFKKPCEWYDLDTHLAERYDAERNLELYDGRYTAELYTKMADFFRRTL